MTTYNHTAIPSSPRQPAAAATINAPLGEIDEAIGNLANLTTVNKTSVVEAANELETNHNTLASEVATARASYGDLDGRLDAIAASITTLDNQLDSLVIDSGTSDAETIAARGSYDTLDDRLADMTLKNSIIYVDSSFAADEATHGRYNDLTTALAAASAGTTIYIAPGVYAETATIPADRVKLIGSGQPDYDSGTGRLVGGTILRGRIRMQAYVGLVISDLGVDMVGSNNDCIESSNIIETPVYRNIHNVTILGNGFDSLAHGIYASGDYYDVHNVRIINTHHGIAIHGRYGNFAGLIIERCAGSSVIIKSKASVGSVEGINVSDVVIWGNDASADYKQWGGPFVVQAADGETTKWVNISNVNAHCCVNGVIQVNRLAASGTVSDVQFTNISSNGNKDLALVGDFWLKSGTRLTFVNCSSKARAAGYGFRIDTSDNIGIVYLHGCTGDGTGSGNASGTFTYGQVNGDHVADTVYRAAPRANRQSAALTGYVVSAGISITTDSAVNVASISGIDGGTTEGFSGLILVHVRSSTTTTASTAAYCLFVHRTAYDTSATVEVIESAGLTTAVGANAPAFTFAIDASTHKLTATRVSAPVSATFYFSFTALGNVKVTAA